MNKKLFGYGIWESIISVIFLVLIAYLDYLLARDLIEGKKLSEQIIFTAVFINLLSAVVISLPFISKKAESISNETIKDFLELPDKKSKLTFPVFSNFLGEQALAAFLATVLIYTGKQALQEYGGFISAIYMFSLYFVALVLASISLVRLLAFLTKYHWVLYAIGATLSTGIMFAFFNIGLKLAP
ncbi:hypothetical protein [Thiomicrorhabdus sp. 6S3-12]|uniref:hypothetical protein n=1 Tax=Thiomicrorhabdus sp. 6S3-12 TaxID=2819681 RepID=UPI001AACB59C|nr:hypothetical protein [Thiomicrorhabdus sp. 6S3-12]MBO1924585.1 hypothetical protein [Thiomicrorhabdus sp. 6S3-12]